MHYKDFGPCVRIEYRGSPFDLAYDIVVFTKQPNDTWLAYRGFNSLSNDYAFTSAKELAAELEQKYKNSCAPTI